MSVFFACANSNQALILETFGLPIFACKEKAYMPMPCCQDAKVFKIGRSDFTFNTTEFWTTDDKKIYIVAAASYSIDATSRRTIMKAYKSFHHPKQKFLPRIQNSFRSPFRSSEPIKTDGEVGIQEIISKVIVGHMRKMSINDISSIGLIFIDSIFEEAKCVLKEKNVQLISLKIMEVIEYVGRIVNEDDDDNNADTSEDNHEEEIHEEEIHDEEVQDSHLAFTENEINWDVLENTDSDDSDAGSYTITVIPEEDKVPSPMKMTTTEIIMNQTSVLHVDLSSKTDDKDAHEHVDNVI